MVLSHCSVYLKDSYKSFVLRSDALPSCHGIPLPIIQMLPYVLNCVSTIHILGTLQAVLLIVFVHRIS